MTEKVDRRVRKTKAQLREGLAHLMLEKSIKEITVKELVDKVDINRSTFYLHYADIYQMLQQIEEEALDNITHILENCPVDFSNNESTLEFVTKFFAILDSDKDLCRALLGPHGDMAFVEQIENLLAGTFLKHLPGTFPKNDSNLKYAYAFILNGCVGLIKTWLSQPVQESPAHMAELTCRLIENATQGYLDTLTK
nr:TetR-like C-terminal domain-containing protein [uncultured Blautia sp.]